MTNEDLTVVLTDEEGNENEFIHIDTLELDGQVYVALMPAESAYTEDESELVVLKVLQGEEDDDDILVSIETEEELMTVLKVFEERLEDEYEIDGQINDFADDEIEDLDDDEEIEEDEEE